MEQQKKKKPIFKRWWFWVICIFVFFRIIGSLGDNKTTPTVSDKMSSSQPKTTISIQDLAKNQGAFTGKINHIYRVDTNYPNEDGSYNMINFQTVKGYDSFTANDNSVVKNAIVIENVLPIEQTRAFVSQAASFGAYDKYGNALTVGDIYTQSGEELSDIVFSVPNVKDCAFILVGGIDDTTFDSSQVVFPVQK